MKHIEPRKKWAFIGALALIALVINSSVNRRKSLERQEQQQRNAAMQESRQQTEIERNTRAEAKKIEEDTRVNEQKAERDAAAEAARSARMAAVRFENYLRRYVNAGFSRNQNKKTIAMVVASQNGSFNQTVGTELSRHFSSEGVEIYSSFFTPEFVSDGLFNATFNGSTEAVRNLKLPDTLDGLLLAREQVQYSTNSALENLITASVQLEVMTLSIRPIGQNHSWTFTANGPGFHTADALQMAEERLAKQISTDTKMSLNQISRNNQN